MTATQDWLEFSLSLGEAMIWMLIILVILSWLMEALKVTGLLTLLMKGLSPFLRFSGIRVEAGHLTIVGLLLGISFGAGLLIREVQTGAISPRQIFLSCVFMGFSHSVIEDTLVMLALGADVYGVLFGRLIFTLLVTAAIDALLKQLPDRIFFGYLFDRKEQSLA